MKKRVNIKIVEPVFSVKPPILRTLMNVEMSTGDIRNCLCSKAVVEEILDNGRIVLLNLYNYNKDNNPNKKEEKPKKQEVIKEYHKPKEAVNVKIQEPKKEPLPGSIKEEIKKSIGETKKEDVKKQPKLTPVITVKKDENKVSEEEKDKVEKK